DRISSGDGHRQNVCANSRPERYRQKAHQSKRRVFTNQNIQFRRLKMKNAVISASAGLVGSLIGGVSTFAASWVTQRRLLGTQTRMHHARQRQKLYSEFIIEATRCLEPPGRRAGGYQ